MVQEYLDFQRLENLHQTAQQEYNVLGRENDQSTEFHSRFYSMCDKDIRFDNLYQDFIKEYVSKMFLDEYLVYQKRPTFRVALTNNVAVGEWHKDSNYDHPFEEINFYVPLTKYESSNTIWVETYPDAKDYEPIEIDYGQAFVFSGGLLNHGNQINVAGKTRVSFDFRILKSKDYDKLKSTVAISVNTGKKFVVGGYYEHL